MPRLRGDVPGPAVAGRAGADQGEVFGPVASDSTCWRVLNSIKPADMDGIAAAGAVAREITWAQRAEASGQTLRASLVAGMPLLDRDGRSVLIIDEDATIVVAHSEKQSVTRGVIGSTFRSDSADDMITPTAPPEDVRAPAVARGRVAGGSCRRCRGRPGCQSGWCPAY
jgi:hypothetical protein